MSKVIVCSCVHKYQDEKYGENKRVMNKTGKGYRCTVCGKDKTS
jgi:hypothetical protein